MKLYKFGLVNALDKVGHYQLTPQFLLMYMFRVYYPKRYKQGADRFLLDILNGVEKEPIPKHILHSSVLPLLTK